MRLTVIFITEGGVIARPARVVYEKLNAVLVREVDLLHDVFFVGIVNEASVRVINDGKDAVALGGMDDLLALVAVKLTARLAKATVGIAADEHGRLVGLSRLKAIFKVEIAHAARNNSTSVAVLLENKLPVATPDKRAEVDLAVVLVGSSVVQHIEGRAVRSRKTHAGLDGLSAPLEDLLRLLKLAVVSTRQIGCSVLIAGREMPVGGIDRLKRDVAVALVLNDAPSLDNVEFLANTVIRRYDERIIGVAHGDSKRVAAYLVGLITEPRATRAIRKGDLEGRRDFRGTAKGAVLLKIVRAATGPLQRGTLGNVSRVVDPAAPMVVTHRFVKSRYHDGVGAFGTLE